MPLKKQKIKDQKEKQPIKIKPPQFQSQDESQQTKVKYNAEELASILEQPIFYQRFRNKTVLPNRQKLKKP